MGWRWSESFRHERFSVVCRVSAVDQAGRRSFLVKIMGMSAVDRKNSGISADGVCRYAARSVGCATAASGPSISFSDARTSVFPGVFCPVRFVDPAGESRMIHANLRREKSKAEGIRHTEHRRSAGVPGKGKLFLRSAEGYPGRIFHVVSASGKRNVLLVFIITDYGQNRQNRQKRRRMVTL